MIYLEKMQYPLQKVYLLYVDNPREYLIYSEWKDLDSFRKFMLSKEFKNTTDYGKQIIEGRPYHRPRNKCIKVIYLFSFVRYIIILLLIY